MNKQYKIGDKVLVRGIVNSEVSNGGIHVLHDGVDAFYTLDQINKPAKVVVPKYIDEKIRYCKQTEGYGLFHAMDYCYQYKDSADWLESNEELFARAWLDGYEVKKERLYTVEIPNTNDDSLTVLEFISDSCIVLSQMESFPDNWKEMDIYQLTESEIRQDFEWAWDAGFAEPVKVEEVE